MRSGLCVGEIGSCGAGRGKLCHEREYGAATSVRKGLLKTRQPSLIEYDRGAERPLAFSSPSVVFGSRLVAGEDLVKLGERCRVEAELDGADRRVQVAGGARSDDRGRNGRLMQEPGERHVTGLEAKFGAKALVGFDLRTQAVKLFWKRPDGVPYAYLSALPRSIKGKAGTLVFAINAGMFDPQLKPVSC